MWFAMYCFFCAEMGKVGNCPLNQNLTHFHAVDGLPPDILNDFLEGIIPVCHLVLRIWGSFLIHFLIELTNHRSSPSMTFNSMDTTGRNGFENWPLLRLLPLLIAHDLLERDHAWVILMLLKDILELVMSSHFTDRLFQQLTLCFEGKHKSFKKKKCAWHSIGTYLGCKTLEDDSLSFRLLSIL